MPNESTSPPAEFMAKMAGLLGNEFAQFEQSTREPPAVGLRVNTLKLTAADFNTLSPFSLKPVGTHEPAGFLVTDGRKPGKHPFHAAGLYYLQEPSAMVVGALVRPSPGELVLDLAAAPGGKATHLAAHMAQQGLVVANDLHTGRARLLAENMTRWGVKNALITNATPDRLAEQFGPIFDRVLLDAPCSGEGMFRRSGALEWNAAIVSACARRQTAVLGTAARLVRPGGQLVYATCTFSPEENESVIARFLHDFPDFALVDPPRTAGFARGQPAWAGELPADEAARLNLHYSVRLWPHLFPGEGHFIAVMQRRGEARSASFPKLFRPQPPEKALLAVWQAFARDHLAIELPEERLLAVNGRLYLMPESTLESGQLHLIRYGLLLGEVRKGYFRPDHALALALHPNQARQAVSLPVESEEIAAYLQGQDFPNGGPDGWLLVAVDGFASGWGKRVNGRIKNHYPRGLRFNSDWRRDF